MGQLRPTIIQRWIAERAIVEADAITGCTDLYADFRVWFIRRHARQPMSARAFGDALTDHQVLLAGRTKRKGLRLRHGPDYLGEVAQPAAPEAPQSRRTLGPFGDWLAERATYHPDAVERVADLYTDYCRWTEHQLAHAPLSVRAGAPMSSRAFGDALRDRQIRLSGKTTDGFKLRQGLRLTDLPLSAPPPPRAASVLGRSIRQRLAAALDAAADFVRPSRL